MCHIFIFSTPHVAFHLRQPRLPTAVMATVAPVAPPAPAVPVEPTEPTAPRCGSRNVTGHVVWVTYGKIGEHYGTKKRFHDGKTMGFEWNFHGFLWDLMGIIGTGCGIYWNLLGFRGAPWQNCLKTVITGGAPPFQISNNHSASHGQNHVCHGQKLRIWYLDWRKVTTIWRDLHTHFKASRVIFWDDHKQSHALTIARPFLYYCNPKKR